MLPRALPSPSCTLGPTSWTSPAQWFWCQSDEQECGFGIKFVFFSFIFSFYFFLSSYFFIVDFSFSFSYFVWNFSFPLLFLSSWIFLFLSLAWVFFPFSCFFFFTSANNIIGIWYIENGEKKLKNEFFFFFFGYYTREITNYHIYHSGIDSGVLHQHAPCSVTIRLLAPTPKYSGAILRDNSIPANILEMPGIDPWDPGWEWTASPYHNIVSWFSKTEFLPWKHLVIQ